MESLIQEFKTQIADTYRKYGNEVCLKVNGGKTYTGKEIADEIENETEFGIETMFSLIRLSIDLVKRDKIHTQ